MITKDKPATPENEIELNARREFLRKSIYAVYATPVIMSLVVEEANAWSSKPPPPPPFFKGQEEGGPVTATNPRGGKK